MQSKYFKFLIIALAVCIIAPQIAMASWWNPMSWGMWNRIFHFQQTQQKQEKTDNYFEIKELSIKFKIPEPLKDLTYRISTLQDGTKIVGFTTNSLLNEDKACGPTSIGALEVYTGTPPADAWYSFQEPVLVQGDLRFYYVHPQAVCANSQDNKKAIQLQGNQTNLLQNALRKIEFVGQSINQKPPVVGGGKDSHGCVTDGGYTWCAAKNKCLRSWEEKCQ